MAINDLPIESVQYPGIMPNRNFEHRFFAAFAALFVIAVLVGFGPTFYLKPLFTTPPIARTIIWIHGFVMAAWVILFVTQVYFISSKRIKLHQKLGILGVIIAPILVVTTGKPNEKLCPIFPLTPAPWRRGETKTLLSLK